MAGGRLPTICWRQTRLFLVATLASYFALRIQSHNRLHWLERVADAAFIIAMSLLTLACFIITYTLSG